MPSKFVVVMVVYGVLAAIGVYLLKGQFRWAILILLGGLALKTLIARAARW